MYSVRSLTRAVSIRLLHPSSTLKSNMSTTGALYTSASLKAANAQPFSIMNGKLDPMLLQALKDDMKFEFMTPVQNQVLTGLPSLKSDW